MFSPHRRSALICPVAGVVALALTFWTHPAQANQSLFDGFEDGDYTANPAWEVENPLGEASVEADPVGPDAFALHIHGTDQAHYTLQTAVDLPWTGFRYSAEFLATTTVYHPSLELYDNVSGTKNGYVLLLHGYGSGDSLFRLIEVTDDSYTVIVELPVNIGDIPTNEWLRLSMWHDCDSGLVHADVRRVSDDALIAELSLTPTLDLAANPGVSQARIGAEETAWQYLDNVELPDQCEANDCNANNVPDECDIASGTSSDCNANGIPDECDIPGDINGDGCVDIADLAELLGNYGACVY